MGKKNQKSNKQTAPPPPPTLRDHFDSTVKSIQDGKEVMMPTAAVGILTIVTIFFLCKPKKSTTKKPRVASIAENVADGHALCAIVASANPKALDLEKTKSMAPEERLQTAIDAAEKHLNVSPPESLQKHSTAATYVTQLRRASSKLGGSSKEQVLSLSGQGSLAEPGSPALMLTRSRSIIQSEILAEEAPPPLVKGSSKVEHQNADVTAAVAATFVEEVTASSSSPSSPLSVVPHVPPVGRPNVSHIKVVINKEELASKLGVELTRDESDETLVVTKISATGAAARTASCLEGVLTVGDRVIACSGYTNVVFLDAHADKDDPPTAHLTCAMLRQAVGVVKLKLKRKKGGYGSVKVVSASVQKEKASDTVGINLMVATGDKYPHVSKVTKGGKASGELYEGDLIMSVEAATTAERIHTATAHAATGNGIKATALFLSSALGPITFEVERIVEAKARKASVVTLAAADAAERENADYYRTRMSTIAAADVTGKGGSNGTLSPADLEKVGLGPKDVRAGSELALA